MGIPVSFTAKVEDFIAHDGPKMSYTTKRLGSELHLKSQRILFEQGITDIDIAMDIWDDVPAFFKTTEGSMLPYDVFAASFFLLSRYEEYQPHVKDLQGRFPAVESVAYKFGFLEVPVVDIWIMRFRESLKKHYPEFEFSKKEVSRKIVVEVSQAYAFKQVGFLRTVGGYVKDLVQLRFKRIGQRTLVGVGAGKDPYDHFEWLLDLQKRSAQKFLFLFELGDYSHQSKNIRHTKAPFRSLLQMIADYSEVGLLLSPAGARYFKQFKSEMRRLEQITKRAATSIKVAGYNLSLPQPYRNALEQEVTTDYTMGYPDYCGFRASTSMDFVFYDLDYECATPMVIHPQCASARQVIDIESRTVDTVKLNSIYEEIEKVNGAFTMSFCTTQFEDETSRELIKTLAFYEK